MPSIATEPGPVRATVDLRSVATAAAKFAVTALLLWLALRGVDFSDVLGRAGALDTWAILAALALAVGQVSLAMLRWHRLLLGLGARPPFGTVAAALLLERFVNQAVPGLVGGDAARSWAVIRVRVPAATAVTSIVLDRATAILGVVVLIALTLPWLGGVLQEERLVAPVRIVTALALAGAAALLLAPMVLHRITLPRQGWAGRAAALLGGLVRPLRQRSMLAVAIALSAAMHLCSVLTIYVLCRSLGLPISAGEALVLIPLVVFVGLLPISINGWGVREAAMISLLGQVGVGAAEALAVSIIFGMVGLLTGLVGGLVWLAIGRGRRSEGRAAPADAG